MKQVTMESVKQRIADLESAGKVVGGLSLSSEFELSCLRELVAVTEHSERVSKSLETALGVQADQAKRTNQLLGEIKKAEAVIGSLGWMGLDTAISLELTKLNKQISDLQGQVSLLTEQRDALVVESNTNLHSAAHELNTSWMMHKTMMGAQAALLCISQGDIKSARDWLEGTTDEAFTEMPDDMTPSGLQAWFDSNMVSEDGRSGFLTHEEALERLRQRVPATEAAIASLRAEELQSYADSIALRLKDKELSMRQKERLNFAWAEVKAYMAEQHNR